ncbi:hypothetical protein HDU67_002064 [Dinochytrium kinnereticum]|nr:hypothetical protein HDU67_002064 [Dinochytrium kinnereticum]
MSSSGAPETPSDDDHASPLSQSQASATSVIMSPPAATLTTNIHSPAQKSPHNPGPSISPSDRPPLFPNAPYQRAGSPTQGSRRSPLGLDSDVVRDGVGGASLIKAAAKRRSQAALAAAAAATAAASSSSSSFPLSPMLDSPVTASSPSEAILPVVEQQVVGPPSVVVVPADSDGGQQPSMTDEEGKMGRRSPSPVLKSPAGSLSSRRSVIPPAIVIREPSNATALDSHLAVDSSNLSVADLEDDAIVAKAVGLDDQDTSDEIEASRDDSRLAGDEEVDMDGFLVEEEEEAERRMRRKEERRKRRKKRKKREHQNGEGGGEEGHGKQKKKKKFSLAPRNWLDRLLFLWGFRLLNRIRRHEDIHEMPLHLKSSESAKFTGDALERTWNEEVERCRRLGGCGAGPTLDRILTSTFSRGKPANLSPDKATSPASVTSQHQRPPLQQGAGSDKTFVSLPGDGEEVDSSSKTETSTSSTGRRKGGRSKGRKLPAEDVELGGGPPPRPRHRMFGPTSRPRLHRALNRAFGVRFSLLAIWKALWALFTWLGAYGILKWIIDYCEARTAAADGRPVNSTPPPTPGLTPLGPLPAEGPTAPPLYQGHLLALALFLSSSFSSICFHQLSIQCTRIGVQCRAAMMVLIYRKSLRLSYVKGGVGDIVNLIANECNRVAEASVTWHYMWSAIAECAIIIALAFYDIGIAALPAFFLIMFILLPLQYYIAVRSSSISLRSTGLITKRVHLMSEILTAIKLIKFYAWESHFVKRISKARVGEMAELRTSMMLRAANCMVVFIAPVVATLGATISLQHLEDFFNLPEVDPPVMQEPPADDPDLLIDIKNASFVWDGELDHPSILDLSLEIHRGQLIAVVGDLSSGKSLLAAILGQVKRRSGTMMSYGTCGYAPQEPWLINATIRDNILFGLDYDEQLYLDVIRLCGLTRDLMLLSNGDESVVSDLNLSTSQRQRLSLARCLYRNPDLVLVEDCLSDFDQAHAKRLFKECVRNSLLRKGKAAVLVTQQKMFLPECDLILVLKGERIIERGTFAELKARKVNFSAWVSDYVPIDDDPAGVLDGVNEIRLDGPLQATVSGGSPMSPVSSTVTRFVAASKISTSTPSLTRSPFAQGRLVHLHKPSPLATADVITQDPMELQSVGADADTGQMTIRAIMALNQQSIQNKQINEHTISKMIERNQVSVLNGSPSRPPANFPNQDPVARTIEANQLTVHSVNGFDPALAAGDRGIITRTSFSPVMAYDMYLREGYGRIVGWSIVVLFFLVHGIRFFSDFWLQLFVDGRESRSRGYHIGIYGVITAAIAIGVFARGALFSNSVLRKSTTLHDRCLHRCLYAPMSFFDVTPLGQVLSNFARHLFLVDESLPDATLQALSFAPIPVGTLALVAAVVPWFWVTLPVYVLAAFALVWRCAVAERKLRTLEASNKSPMFAHLSTTLEGLFSIRLYEAQERFDAFNRILIDADHKALYSLMLIKILQALYLDLISSFAIYMTALLVIASPSVTGSTAGLAISNVLQLLLFVQWMVRMGTDVHLCMTSVAAVTSFTDHVPVEDGGDGVMPPMGWPSSGAIEFKHVTLRYHRYGIAVLKAVSFHFNPGEKIGIVGRSGSGKTTLLAALMRIVDSIEGEIYVDGIDITTLNLSELRSRIAVIPQEPVLLTGTIRTNLDPFDVRTDEEVWRAVRDVHLGAKIEEMPLKLDTPISENGRAFSLAERQLFCVARAILMKTKIVIFDEPTTAADNDTDALIQSTIHDNFEDATVIVLASRFRMITQADRIIVMDGGRIVESDTPLALLDNPRSKLSLMVSQTGDVDIAKLRQLAHNRAEAKAAKAAANLAAAPPAPPASNLHNASPVLLTPQVHHALAVSAHDSHSSISTLSSSHSGAVGDGVNPALTTAGSGSSVFGNLLSVGGGSAGARKPGAAMPKSLEGIFGETAQLERQQKAAAGGPLSPLSPTPLTPISPTGVAGGVGASSASVHSARTNGEPSSSSVSSSSGSKGQ